MATEFDVENGWVDVDGQRQPVIEWHVMDDAARTYSIFTDSTKATLISSRPYNSAENTRVDEIARIKPQIDNAATLRQQASGALQSNRDYLAISAPTNAQVVAQVRALTQQNIRVIRLLLSQLDGVN